jgi:hypothetical protein
MKLKENPGRDRVLSDDEISRLLSSCRQSRSPYLYCIVLIALTTGARQGEILNLEWRDIDFDNKLAFIRETKNGRPRSISLSDPVIVSAESKRRVNFLEILYGDGLQYVVNADAADYVETLRPESWLRGLLVSNKCDHPLTGEEFERFLDGLNLASKNDERLVTEAALFAGLLAKGIPKTLRVHGDDAGQFDVFVRSLCWVHEERHFRKLIPIDEETQRAIGIYEEGFGNCIRGCRNTRGLLRIAENRLLMEPLTSSSCKPPRSALP